MKSLLHRKAAKDTSTNSRPLACSTLGEPSQRLLSREYECGVYVCTADLMVEFMISHMAKNFKLDLYK